MILNVVFPHRVLEHLSFGNWAAGRGGKPGSVILNVVFPHRVPEHLSFGDGAAGRGRKPGTTGPAGGHLLGQGEHTTGERSTERNKVPI